jgi:hypothetical protein
MDFLAHIEIGELRQPFFCCSVAFVISDSLENLLENDTAQNGPIMLSDEVFEPICCR